MNINDFDKDGGIFVPSSFSRIDATLKQELEELIGNERVGLILKKCFGASCDAQLTIECDFPLVEIEDNLFVLELASAKSFETVDAESRPFVIAAVLMSACIDLNEKETNLFFPIGNDDLQKGAVLAKNAGADINIFVGAGKDSQDGDVTYIEVDDSEIKAIIKDFSDFDDYVFDPVSALAAGAFACLEDEIEDMPSIIVSVENPLDRALDVARALGIKARDEDEAKRKLEEMYALS